MPIALHPNQFSLRPNIMLALFTRAMQRIISLLIVLLAQLSLAATPAEVAKLAFPSTVLIVIEDAQGQPLSLGSGFILKTGVVVTNVHVIEGGARGYVKQTDSKTKHDIIGILRADSRHDLAVLSVPSLSAPPLKLAASGPLAVGDTVFAVGNPQGLEGTFSQGIVSSLRQIGSENILQITAPISPGSSGGPVLNDRGEVVGVAVATFKEGQNLNFAIPSSYLENVEMLATPAPFAKLQAKKSAQSVLADIGGSKSTDGVTAGQLIWDNQFEEGSFTFSIRNGLRESVKDVSCLVIFYDANNKPIDYVLIKPLTKYYSPIPAIPGGLAKRISGRVDASVKKLTTPKAPDNQFLMAKEPSTKVEFRILDFNIGDE